jgi:uncharacterized protein (DUF2236 family)
VSRGLDRIDGVAGLLAGPANVVMQLSRPEVGYGVLESKVHSGKITEHPIKRGRTTFTYLAVATMGRDADRRRYRRAVDSAHAAVRSGPDSPVEYNAFDPELQLWVAACLYRGAADAITRFRGPLDDEAADELYRESARLGTTLQVPPEMWPPDRAAFERYWASAMTRVSVDPAVREYLLDVVTLRFLHLPGPVINPIGRFYLWVTTGFLPPEFRDAMGLEWSVADQDRFDRFIGVVAATRRPLPGFVRRAPLNFYLWDFRLRTALGWRVV